MSLKCCGREFVHAPGCHVAKRQARELDRKLDKMVEDNREFLETLAQEEGTPAPGETPARD